jgi:hypothetical protein
MDLSIRVATFMTELLIGLPIAVMGLASLAYPWGAGIPFVAIAQTMHAGMNVFVPLCIPCFILATDLRNAGGTAERIVRFANALGAGARQAGADRCGGLHTVRQHFGHGGGGRRIDWRHDDTRDEESRISS